MSQKYPISDVANPVVRSSEEVSLLNVALCDIIVFGLSLTICVPEIFVLS